MKRILIYIGMISAGFAGSRNALQLQTGDLLFRVGGESAMSRAITEATAHDRPLDFTHVGIVLHHDRADSILEAAPGHGVRIIGLEEFLGDKPSHGRIPRAVAMRLRDTTGVARAVARARSFVGLPYDFAYHPHNDRLYCSELVWESYLTPDGRPLFPARPMNFRAADGSMPAFWTELFAELGEPIPEGLPGTNPNDMAREPLLEKVCNLY